MIIAPRVPLGKVQQGLQSLYVKLARLCSASIAKASGAHMLKDGEVQKA